jgi:hypothetical protein
MAKEKVDLSRAQWRTSSFSGSNGDCVQVAFVANHVAVRDSKDPHGPALIFTPDEWTAFLAGARDGEFSQA